MSGAPEEWRPISGSHGYDVSDAGRVRCWWKHQSRRPMRFADEPRIIFGVRKKGYLSVYLPPSEGWKGGHKQVHRLVLEAFVGPCPQDMECRHMNGSRDDNRLANLQWGTRAENAEDKRKHGTIVMGDAHYSRRAPHRLARGDDHGFRKNPGVVPRGATNGNAKLCDGDVIVIRMLRELSSDDRPTLKEVGDAFRMDPSTVGDICRRKAWRHVPGSEAR